MGRCSPAAFLRFGAVFNFEWLAGEQGHICACSCGWAGVGLGPFGSSIFGCSHSGVRWRLRLVAFVILGDGSNMLLLSLFYFLFIFGGVSWGYSS